MALFEELAEYRLWVDAEGDFLGLYGLEELGSFFGGGLGGGLFLLSLQLLCLFFLLLRRLRRGLGLGYLSYLFLSGAAFFLRD